jgi:hypothetical protein
MTWAKLPNAGDSLTMVVKSAGEHQSPSKDLSIRFDSRNDETIYLPRLVGEQHLRNLGFGNSNGVIDYNRVCGQTLKFSRVAAPVAGDRPHWKLETVRAVEIPREEPAPVLNDHLPPAGVTHVQSNSRHTPNPPAVSIEPGTVRREIVRAQIEDAYLWAHRIVAANNAKLAKKKGQPKPTADSIENGVTTLMLRAERMNAI